MFRKKNFKNHRIIYVKVRHLTISLIDIISEDTLFYIEILKILYSILALYKSIKQYINLYIYIYSDKSSSWKLSLHRAHEWTWLIQMEILHILYIKWRWSSFYV